MGKNLETKSREEVIGIYSNFNAQCPNLSGLARNLNHLYLTDRIDPVYHRDTVLETIQKTLLRKGKANVLLTGPAGCGKTAIAEGLAAIIAERRVAYQVEWNKAYAEYRKAHKAWDKHISNDGEYYPEPQFIEPERPMLSNLVIYDLSLTTLVGGTKDRGEFEERVSKIIEECRNNPNVVLFIDEIHQIVRAGATESNEGAAQMLKPALARKDIRLIGATTNDEIKEMVKDSALMRRFNRIEVLPLLGDAAVDTAEHIMHNYAEYHKVSVATEVESADLLSLIHCFLPNSIFPDNFINLVDETMASAVFEGAKNVGMSDFKATLSRMTGKVII